MAVNFQSGGYDDDGGFDWDDWLRRERELNNRPAPEVHRIDPVRDDPPPVNVARSTQQAPEPPAPIPTVNAQNGGGPRQPDPPGPDGNYRNDPDPPPPPPPAPPVDPVQAMIDRDKASWEQRARESAAKSGVGYHESDLQGIIRNLSNFAQNPNRNTDPDALLRALEEQYRVRGASGGDRSKGGYDTDLPDDPAARAQALAAQRPVPPPMPAPSVPFPGTAGANRPTAAWNGPQPTTVPAQYSDPITKFLEAFAQRRAQELETPPSGSGQQLFEDAIRRISSQFESGGFTPAEQEVFTTQQIEPLEQLRQARRQQVLHELTARGIPPTSGVALQMLQDVDRQFDGLRVQAQSQLASRAANERTSRMQMALQQLAGLAQAQNQRLDQAYQYRTVPVNLADRAFNQASQVFNMNEGSANNAFNRAFQMFNATGNPLTLAQPMMALSQQQQGRDDGFQRGMAELIWMLTQGGQRAA